MKVETRLAGEGLDQVCVGVVWGEYRGGNVKIKYIIMHNKHMLIKNF